MIKGKSPEEIRKIFDIQDDVNQNNNPSNNNNDSPNNNDEEINKLSLKEVNDY
mgnify:FL=1